jgi:hypothetical protein
LRDKTENEAAEIKKMIKMDSWKRRSKIWDSWNSFQFLSSITERTQASYVPIRHCKAFSYIKIGFQ